MIVNGTSTNGEKFPCRIYPAAGFRLGFLAFVRSARKFFASGRGAERRLPFPPVLFRRSSPYGYRKVVQPQNMLV